MAKTRFIQNAFTSGVVSPLLKGRTDLEQYYQGLETGSNWVLIPQGGIKRRPGTKFIQKALPVLTRNTTVPTAPSGGTAANANDNNEATVLLTTVNIGTGNPYVVALYDLGAAAYIEMVDIRDVFLTSLTSSEFVVQYSVDDITYTTAATVPLIGAAPQDFRLYVGQTARYWRLARVGATDLGTDKVSLSEFNLLETTATLSNVKLKDFSVETERHYLFSFTDGNVRIFRSSSDAHVADIKLPYLSAEVGEIRDVQSESVILLFHKDYPTKRIVNLGTDIGWVLDDAPYINIPQFDYNDSLSPTPINDVQILTFVAFIPGDTFQIDIEGVLSKNITFAGDTGADEQAATAENIRKNIQEMPVVGETGVAVARTGALAYTITISGESTKAFKLFSAFPTSGTASKSITFTHTTTGSPRKEDVWSATRGYPKTACYFEGRLIIGGTKSKQQSIFASKSGSAYNFDIGDGDDDDAIFTTISSRKLNNIVDVFPGRNLQIFTDGSEFSVNVSPITPTTIGNIVSQTSHGSRMLEAKEIDGATIFADRNGKSIRQFLYSFNEDSYVSADISVLTPELIKTPVDIAILGGTSSDNSNWVFIVNTDGSASVLNTLRAQDINGFTEWTTSGAIKDASVVDDELYMVNKRTVGGVESYFIERWDFSFRVDNGLTIANPGASTTISGLNHLEGETVKVSAIDENNTLRSIVMPDRVVSGGAITLTASESLNTSIQVGIGFISTLKAMPINTNIGSGQNAMRRKKIIRMNMRVQDSGGIQVDEIPLPVRAFGDSSSSPLGSFPNITTGVIDDILGITGWSIDDMPTFTVNDATSCTILAIEYEVESS